ncbi:MAG: HupE/UreJ family protein [Janthinobacterium lividum]
MFVGLEIVKLHRGEGGLTTQYPWAIAFSFGLVHGIGFASALSVLGIEHALLFPVLLSFNVGVELHPARHRRISCPRAWAISMAGRCIR